MLITTGTVNDGTIQIETKHLPEGSKVTILAQEGDETFELNAEHEAELAAAIAEAERGFRRSRHSYAAAAHMNPPLPVRIVSSAAQAIAEAAEWWATNRPTVPDAFVNNLENALQLIASHPEIGARAQNVRLEGVRRVHLAAVHYHL